MVSRFELTCVHMKSSDDKWQLWHHLGVKLSSFFHWSKARCMIFGIMNASTPWTTPSLRITALGSTTVMNPTLSLFPDVQSCRKSVDRALKKLVVAGHFSSVTRQGMTWMSINLCRSFKFLASRRNLLKLSCACPSKQEFWGAKMVTLWRLTSSSSVCNIEAFFISSTKSVYGDCSKPSNTEPLEESIEESPFPFGTEPNDIKNMRNPAEHENRSMAECVSVDLQELYSHMYVTGGLKNWIFDQCNAMWMECVQCSLPLHLQMICFLT